MSTNSPVRGWAGVEVDRPPVLSAFLDIIAGVSVSVALIGERNGVLGSFEGVSEI